jgi:hypothetical protein
MAIQPPPGFSIAPPVKGVLASIEGVPTSVPFQFNPTELTIDKPVPWQKHPGGVGNTPTLEFLGPEPRTLACELLFDLLEAGGDVYAAYISKLETLTLVDGNLKRPPLCSFTWGSMLPVFKGVVEQLTTKYTMFLPDGTPVRATVSLRMRQAGKLLNQSEAAAGAAGVASRSMLELEES